VKADFKKSFSRDLKKIKDKELLKQVKEAVEEVETAQNFLMVSNLKQLKGGDSYFRIKLGDYRIGLKLEGDTMFFVRFLHRKEIYRYFP
jgi:mRNA interferase RelE/StbE